MWLYYYQRTRYARRGYYLSMHILLSPDKCKIAYTSLRTLGNVLTPQGTCADPEKVTAVMSWPVPTNREELLQFLSFCNFLRSYVRHYAELAAPLDSLRSPKVPFDWTPLRQSSFDLLKHAIATSPTLNFPDYDKPFAIACDSSIYGIGAVLFQPA